MVEFKDGMKWKELTKDQQEEVLSKCFTVDGRTENEAHEGECIIDLDENYSVSGKLVSYNEDYIPEIQIDDNAVIYKSTI